MCGIGLFLPQLYTMCVIYRNNEGVKAPTYSRRVYLNDGMIPKYTGYLPRKCCLHSELSFHAHSKNKFIAIKQVNKDSVISSCRTSLAIY